MFNFSTCNRTLPRAGMIKCLSNICDYLCREKKDKDLTGNIFCKDSYQLTLTSQSKGYAECICSDE